MIMCKLGRSFDESNSNVRYVCFGKTNMCHLDVHKSLFDISKFYLIYYLTRTIQLSRSTVCRHWTDQLSMLYPSIAEKIVVLVKSWTLSVSPLDNWLNTLSVSADSWTFGWACWGINPLNLKCTRNWAATKSCFMGDWPVHHRCQIDYNRWKKWSDVPHEITLQRLRSPHLSRQAKFLITRVNLVISNACLVEWNVHDGSLRRRIWAFIDRKIKFLTCTARMRL